MGQDLQNYILAHGYQIEPLWMPFRSIPLRKAAIKSFLQNQKSKRFHFILSEKTWTDVADLLQNNAHPHSTFTLIGQLEVDPILKPAEPNLYQFTSTGRAPLSYILHSLFCKVMGSTADPYGETLLDQNKLLYDRFLDHCIELAENE